MIDRSEVSRALAKAAVPAEIEERKMTKAIEKAIRRETDKALLVEVVTGRGNHAQVWLPKSQVAVKSHMIEVADWLLAKKAAEIGGIITLDASVAAQLAA